MSLFVLGAFGAPGCEPQSEGDRCSGGSGTDECSSGLTCVVPQNCLVSYCCPISQKNTNGICGGCESTETDTGTDDDTADATDAAVDDAGADVTTDAGSDATDGAVDATGDEASDADGD